MYEPEMSLDDLGALARQGDEEARAELKRRLAPHMPRIIRRALRRDIPNVGLTRRIRRAAAPLQSDGYGWPAERGPGLLKRVAGRILRMVAGASGKAAAPALHLRETVRC